MKSNSFRHRVLLLCPCVVLISALLLSPVQSAAPCGAQSDVQSGEPYTDIDYEDRRARLLADAAASAVADAPYAVQTAFCAVLLNRVRSPFFPDTLPGVITDAGLVPIPGVAPPRLYRAAHDALDGCDPTRGALYALPPGLFPDDSEPRLRFTCRGWAFT